MSSDTVLLSPLAKIKVNGNRYGVTDGRLYVSSTRLEKTDSGDYIVNSAGKIFHFRNFTSTLYMIEATITAQRTGDAPPHNARRLNIDVQQRINLIVSPDGSFVKERTYQMDAFLVENYKAGFQVRGSQPQTFEFSGVGTAFRRVVNGVSTPQGTFIQPTDI